MLSVTKSSGLANLTIHSGSLLELHLENLYGLQQLTLVAPALKKLALLNSFVQSRPVANISTTQLIWLQWLDSYDPTSVKLGNLAQLQQLAGMISVYRLHPSWFSNGFLQLLDQFQVIRNLTLMLFYPKASYMCPSGCACNQPTDWKTEELTLNCLQEVAIDMEAADHQVAFVKCLFTWAVVLNKMEITFPPSIGESKARELHQTLLTFFRPGTHVEFYMYGNAGWAARVTLHHKTKEAGCDSRRRFASVLCQRSTC